MMVSGEHDQARPRQHGRCISQSASKRLFIRQELPIAKNQNTYAKRQREHEKKQRADQKRAKRDKKKDGPDDGRPQIREYEFPAEDRDED